METPTEYDLMNAIKLALASRADLLESFNSDKPIEELFTERVIFLTRMLHFSLGLREIWTTRTLVMASDICSSLFKLLIVCVHSGFILLC